MFVEDSTVSKGTNRQKLFVSLFWEPRLWDLVPTDPGLGSRR